MRPELSTHTLLRVAGAESLRTSALPSWAIESLRRGPWVVIRRAELDRRRIPAGVRGVQRGQRLATCVDFEAVLESVTPRALAASGGWRGSPRSEVIPALAALDAVERVMREHGLARAWGPTGSVGFELASGCASATADSDVDLAVWASQRLAVPLARSLLAALEALAVRIDVLIETPLGAVALTEYARGRGRVVLRGVSGPRLVDDCWPVGQTAAA